MFVKALVKQLSDTILPASGGNAVASTLTTAAFSQRKEYMIQFLLSLRRPFGARGQSATKCFLST